MCRISCFSFASGWTSIFSIYTMDSPEQWTEHGVLHFPPYYYRQELPLLISPDQGGGNASMIIQHEGAQLAFIDYVALRDGNGNLYVPYLVSVLNNDITAEAQAKMDLGWVTGAYVLCLLEEFIFRDFL